MDGLTDRHNTREAASSAPPTRGRTPAVGRPSGSAPAVPGEFGALLGSLRTARGWSQGVLARKAALDPSSVSRFEAGTRAPDRETVLGLAEAMALPVVERDRLLAVAGFRSGAMDDPLLAELVEVLADPTLSEEVEAEVRTLVRVAVQHGRRGRPAHQVPRQ